MRPGCLVRGVYTRSDWLMWDVYTGLGCLVCGVYIRSGCLVRDVYTRSEWLM